MSKWQQREAQRLGLDRAIERAEDNDYQRRMRELRDENMRRAGAAK